MKYDLSNDYKVQCFNEYAAKLIKDKKHVELKEVKLKRSVDQNALYWLWLTTIQHETGMLKDDLHCMYRALYLPKPDEYIEKIIRPDLWQRLKQMVLNFHHFKGLDQIIDVISEHTPNQETDEFSKYLKSIQNHARENMGIILLNQKDQQFEAFYREYGFI